MKEMWVCKACKPHPMFLSTEAFKMHEELKHKSVKQFTPAEDASTSTENVKKLREDLTTATKCIDSAQYIIGKLQRENTELKEEIKQKDKKIEDMQKLCNIPRENQLVARFDEMFNVENEKFLANYKETIHCLYKEINNVKKEQCEKDESIKTIYEVLQSNSSTKINALQLQVEYLEKQMKTNQENQNKRFSAIQHDCDQLGKEQKYLTNELALSKGTTNGVKIEVSNFQSDIRIQRAEYDERISKLESTINQNVNAVEKRMETAIIRSTDEHKSLIKNIEVQIKGLEEQIALLKDNQHKNGSTDFDNLMRNEWEQEYDAGDESDDHIKEKMNREGSAESGVDCGESIGQLGAIVSTDSLADKKQAAADCTLAANKKTCGVNERAETTGEIISAASTVSSPVKVPSQDKVKEAKYELKISKKIYVADNRTKAGTDAMQVDATDIDYIKALEQIQKEVQKRDGQTGGSLKEQNNEVVVQTEEDERDVLYEKEDYSWMYDSSGESDADSDDHCEQLDRQDERLDNAIEPMEKYLDMDEEFMRDDKFDEDEKEDFSWMVDSSDEESDDDTKEDLEKFRREQLERKKREKEKGESKRTILGKDDFGVQAYEFIANGRKMTRQRKHVKVKRTVLSVIKEEDEGEGDSEQNNSQILM